MKNQFTLFTALLLISNVFAQAPEKFSYQAVIRDGNNQVSADQGVGMKISILQGSVNGNTIYTETHSAITSNYGLVTIEIGTGTTTDDFSAINWTEGPYFIKTETDPSSEGGTNYTITGISQLLSVPYALHAKKADVITGTINETDPVFEASIASSITGTDTAYWNHKLDSYTETDPSVPSGTQPGEMQYWNGSAWVTIAPGLEKQVLTFTGGVPTWKTPLKDWEVENPATGKIWMDRNLGSSRVAKSSTDTAAYGDLYQWGRNNDGHEKRKSATTIVLSNTDAPFHGDFINTNSSPYDWRTPQNNNLWQGESGINNPCPSGYRLPTGAEWEEERATWSSNDAAGAFDSPLKLPATGSRLYASGGVQNVGSEGGYWSATIDGTNSKYLYFGGSDAIVTGWRRAMGYAVRCIKD